MDRGLRSGWGCDPAGAAARHGLKAVTEIDASKTALHALIAATPGQVEMAKQNVKRAGWLTGQVLKPTEGMADSAVVGQRVTRTLGL